MKTPDEDAFFSRVDSACPARDGLPAPFRTDGGFPGQRVVLREESLEKVPVRRRGQDTPLKGGAASVLNASARILRQAGLIHEVDQGQSSEEGHGKTYPGCHGRLDHRAVGNAPVLGYGQRNGIREQGNRGLRGGAWHPPH